MLEEVPIFSLQEGGKFIPEVEDGHPGVEQVSNTCTYLCMCWRACGGGVVVVWWSMCVVVWWCMCVVVVWWWCGGACV